MSLLQQWHKKMHGCEMIGRADSTKLVHPMNLLDLKANEKESSVLFNDFSFFLCRSSTSQKTPFSTTMTILCMLWQAPRLPSNVDQLSSYLDSVRETASFLLIWI